MCVSASVGEGGGRARGPAVNHADGILEFRFADSYSARVGRNARRKREREREREREGETFSSAGKRDPYGAVNLIKTPFGE